MKTKCLLLEFGMPKWGIQMPFLSLKYYFFSSNGYFGLANTKSFKVIVNIFRALKVMKLSTILGLLLKM